MAKTPKAIIPAEFIKARISGATGLLEMIEKFQDPLVAMFDAVNGNATSFTLAATDAVNTAVKIEKVLAAKGVPPSLRGGTSVTVAGAGPTASSYKYAVKSTCYTMRRDTRGSWTVTMVASVDVWPRELRRELLEVSEAARDAIVKHAMEGITVATPAVVEAA